jgi:lysophospholipase L1-like esterase
LSPTRCSPRPALAVALAILAAGPTAGCGSSQEPVGTADRAERADRAEQGAEPAPLPSGGGRIVFFGDSLAVTGTRPYPERLPGELARRGIEAEVVSVAEPGSDSADWAPGEALFASRLDRQIGKADVFVVTVGGNDIERALGGADGPEAAAGGLDEGGLAAIDGAIAEVRANLRRSFRAIARESPGATVAWVGYPDYSGAAAFEAAGALASIGIGMAIGELAEAASAAGADLLVDTTSASARRDVDTLLDGEYLNDAGHALFARRIAAALAQPAAAGTRP